MAAKTLYMETTQISVDKTAQEITAALVASGARQIAMDYDEAGRLAGLSFILATPAGPVPFKLPVRTEPIYRIFWGRRNVNRLPWRKEDQDKLKAADRAQAERVAWRQLLRWIQAQLAMIDTGMVQSAEVFLPYMQSQDGRTLFEHMAETKFKAIAPPQEATCPRN